MSFWPSRMSACMEDEYKSQTNKRDPHQGYGAGQALKKQTLALKESQTPELTAMTEPLKWT